jgi:hypothetical protein
VPLGKPLGHGLAMVRRIISRQSSVAASPRRRTEHTKLLEPDRALRTFFRPPIRGIADGR